MNKTKKITYAVLALGCVILCFSVFWAWKNLPMWRDTIFISEVDGVVELESGKRYKTNTWVKKDEDSNISLLVKSGSTEYYMIEEHDHNKKATLTVGDSKKLMIITRQVGNSAGYTEFYVR